MFPPAVVSADTSVLLNHSGASTSTSISCLFVEATHFLYHKLYSRETASILYIYIWGTAGSSVWPVKAMLDGCDLHTYVFENMSSPQRKEGERCSDQHACARLGFKLAPPLPEVIRYRNKKKSCKSRKITKPWQETEEAINTFKPTVSTVSHSAWKVLDCETLQRRD